MAVPYTFGSATSAIPLSQLDSNFATAITLGSTALTLGTTTTTVAGLTLTSPVISTISNTGTLTLPTSTDTLVGRATTDTLTNKSISGSSNTLTNIPNSALTNTSVTIGSTSISLGGTATTVAGLTLTSPTMTTPILGTPTSGTLTNCTGLPISTGLSGLTANGVAYATSTSALATVSNLTYSGTSLVNSGSITTGANGGSDGNFVLKRASDGLTVGNLSVDSTNSVLKLSTAYSYLSFSNYAGEMARFNGNGYLGIGTSSPNRLLELSGAASGETYQLRLGAGSTNSSYTYDIGRSTVDGYLRFYGNQSAAQGYIFGGANGEYARLDYSGNLLVGTTSGSDKLTVNGTSASFSSPSGSCTVGIAGQNASGANAVLNFISPGSNSATVQYVRNSAQLQVINGGSGGVYLASSGAAWVAVSDERKKENLIPIANAITKVSSLRAVTGNYIADPDKKSKAFLIAQDVQAVLPEAVDTSDPDVLGLAYTDVIPLLVASIKELSAEVNALKAKLGV